MIRMIIVVLAVLVIGFYVVVALQPTEFRVERRVVISAPAAAVFAQVNDFHNWGAWSPWEKLDPAMKKTFAGATAGTGAVYAWAGNQQVGEGRMSVTESRPHERIRVKLEFLKPFASTCDTEFTFNPDGEQTAVTWTMTGRNNFTAKAFGLLMNMDKVIGGDFEKGLAALKAVAEAGGAN